ncbi:Panacea domain-containing protein [Acinetobacter bereziniae]|uniref:Panacea domain-containing protein n=1 Tax=Acinetobacter bereziniae TaxID=106648 RepID=UPI003AF5EA3F
MNRLLNIIAYFCMEYPFSEDLSNSRLTKLVYLADWVSSLSDNRQMTNIVWLFNHYGPYVDDIKFAVMHSPNFSFHSDHNAFGSSKNVIRYHGRIEDIVLSVRDRQILDYVIEKTQGKYYNEFIDYVYSTYPVQSKNRYATLDLVDLAQEYKSQLF